MRVKITPHGSLLETWPSEFECEARSPAQAINAVTRQFKVQGERNRFSQVRIVGIDSAVALNSPCRYKEYHVVPDFSGGGGFIKILIGAVLVVAGIVLDAYSFGTAGNLLIGLGASMALGGIMDLISPHPKNTAVSNSVYLGAPLNTTQIGTTIVIGYGRFAVYGQFLSYQLQTTQVGTQTGLMAAATPVDPSTWNVSL